MPEGDTLRKVARLLAVELEGRVLAAGWLQRRPGVELAGSRVTNVHALGKHLDIEFDTGVVLRSHLGMTGSWHRYAAGAAWQRPRRQASIVLDTGETQFVCFNAVQAELLRMEGLRDRQQRHRLGPDLSAADTDPGQVARRARERLAMDTPLLDVLLDQAVGCGIGNVYKSELMFLFRVPPATRLGQIGDPRLAALYARAQDLLRLNAASGPRRTRLAEDGRAGLWVYRRRGRLCLRCGACIQSRSMGRHSRITYWCPECQKSLVGEGD